MSSGNIPVAAVALATIDSIDHSLDITSTALQNNPPRC
jgi:hypothetical protein